MKRTGSVALVCFCLLGCMNGMSVEGDAIRFLHSLPDKVEDSIIILEGKLHLKDDNVNVADTFRATNDIFDLIAGSQRPADRIFIYYAGIAKRLGPSGEPALSFVAHERKGEALELPLTDLIRAVADFPSASVVVDA